MIQWRPPTADNIYSINKWDGEENDASVPTNKQP